MQKLLEVFFFLPLSLSLCLAHLLIYLPCSLHPLLEHLMERPTICIPIATESFSVKTKGNCCYHYYHPILPFFLYSVQEMK